MAKIVPVVQLAAHAISSTLYGRTTKFFWLDGLLLLLFCIVMGLPSASSAIKISPVKTMNQLNTRKRKLNKKSRIVAGKKKAALKIMYLFLKLTINKVPVN